MSNEVNVNMEEDVDFELGVIKFNKYELDDGSLIRFLAVPSKFIRTNKFNNIGLPIYFVFTQNVISAVVLPEERGPPRQNPSPSPEEMDFEPINFLPKIEPWNEYSLVDGTTIRLKITANQISKSPLKNQYGEPIYNVNHALSIDTRAPKHLRKRYRKK